MRSVYRRQRVEGLLTPAVIHNGNYFLDNMAVYEDGVINCWHRSDLWQFREDLSRGWVVPGVPKGAVLSVFQLGSFPVLETRWLYGPEEYYRYIQSLVRKLNPEMTNLYRTTRRETDLWESRRVCRVAKPTAFHLTRELGYSTADGRDKFLFRRTEAGVELTTLFLYEDQTLRLGEEELLRTPAEIDDMLVSGELATAPRPEEWVAIPGLGQVQLGASEYTVEREEKRKEIAEALRELSGEPTARDRCVAAYHAYLEEPTDWARERLRKAYEAVPAHERIYLGDMDTRDSDYIRLLHFPDEKREV